MDSPTVEGLLWSCRQKVLFPHCIELQLGRSTEISSSHIFILVPYWRELNDIVVNILV